MSDSAAPWTEAHQVPPSSTVSWSFLKFTSIKSTMLSKHFILCHLLLLLPSVFPTNHSHSGRQGFHISYIFCFFFFLIFKTLLNVLQYCFCSVFWFFGCKACEILASQLEIEPTPPALEGRFWTTREVPFAFNLSQHHFFPMCQLFTSGG